MLYQIRFNLDDELAIAVRGGVSLPELQILNGILEANGAELVCQLDAFENYCKENSHLATKAKLDGDADTWMHSSLPLFMWTDAILKNPKKREKYSRNFTIYAEGEMLYTKTVADALFSSCENLPFVQELRMYNDNPADNPPIPDEFFKIRG